jgi:hypothetical protein
MFCPSDALANPRHFGRVEHPRWHPGALTEVESAWSFIQHKVTFVSLGEMKAHGMSLAELAAELDVPPSWLQRKLYGRVPIDLGDLLAWSLLFGAQVWPAVSEAADLLPAAVPVPR